MGRGVTIWVISSTVEQEKNQGITHLGYCLYWWARKKSGVLPFGLFALLLSKKEIGCVTIWVICSAVEQEWNRVCYHLGYLPYCWARMKSSVLPFGLFALLLSMNEIECVTMWVICPTVEHERNRVCYHLGYLPYCWARKKWGGVVIWKHNLRLSDIYIWVIFRIIIIWLGVH